jgi:hypothetical protein
VGVAQIGNRGKKGTAKKKKTARQKKVTLPKANNNRFCFFTRLRIKGWGGIGVREEIKNDLSSNVNLAKN